MYQTNPTTPTNRCGFSCVPQILIRRTNLSKILTPNWRQSYTTCHELTGANHHLTHGRMTKLRYDNVSQVFDILLRPLKLRHKLLLLCSKLPVVIAVLNLNPSGIPHPFNGR